LFELLSGAARVTEVYAPAGSGKSLLLRSWIGARSLADRSAWVAVQGEERDPQRFWLSLLGALHAAAAGWFADHGYLVEAVRHAQAAQDWGLAARLLSDHWVGLGLDGLGATAHELLARFPAGVIASDAELAARKAGDELGQGSLEEAERYLALAAEKLESVPSDRRGRSAVVLTAVRMRFARHRGDVPAVAEQAQQLLAAAEALGAAELGVGGELRMLALIDLGIAELWTGRFAEADRHLQDGTTLAHQLGRPYLEVTGLAHGAQLASWRSFPLGAQQSMEAIELAARHGWTEEPIAGLAYLALGIAMTVQGRLEEAERSLEHAERTVRAEVEPAAGMRLHYGRGTLELARGRYTEALAAFRTAERLATLLATQHALAMRLRSHLLQTLIRMGETRRAELVLADMDSQERDNGQMRIALAALRLAQDDPQAAAAALAPVVDGSVPLPDASLWEVHASWLDAIARDALGDAAARRALERALDLATPEGLLFPFLISPAPDLLERHRRRGTAHKLLIAEILGVLSGRKPASQPDAPQHLREPLSQAEVRVLRYLPTKLSAPEIADQLYLSVNTVKTHMRHLYDKLGAHRRHEAVEQARALGLLAPSSRR
jgi:LuxR family maltose regulon positive regulatory protein